MGRVSSACTVHVEAWCSRRHFAKFASMPIRLILRAHTQNTMETCQFHACGRPTHTQFYFRNNLTRAETFTRILLLTKWKKKTLSSRIWKAKQRSYRQTSSESTDINVCEFKIWWQRRNPRTFHTESSCFCVFSYIFTSSDAFRPLERIATHGIVFQLRKKIMRTEVSAIGDS